MSVAHSPSLTHLSTTDSTKKKKKRIYKDSVQDIDAEELRKKYKKHVGEVDIADTAQTLLASTDADQPHDKNSKKKTQKRREAASAETSVDNAAQVQDPSSTNPHPPAAALLSTIAAGTPDISNQASTSDANSQHHQMNFPLLQYGFNSNSQLPPSHQSNHLLPPMHVPFADMAFGSNEDVLRALQGIDISKIAHVLKTLEDAASAANVPLPSLGIVSNLSSASALGQSPTPSNAIIANASGSQRGSRARATPQQTHPNHARLLASKWLSAGKLSNLVETEGLVYKKGKFSVTEEQQIKSAIEGYRVNKGLTEDQIMEVIFPTDGKSKDNAFWSEITIAVAQRPIIAVYHHVRRSYHPLKQQGKWSPDEDGLLRQAVADLGQQWEKVSQRVGRMSADCRDRYRNHIVDREIRITGPWSKEEEEQLTRIVTRMTVEQGRDLDNDVFWGKVSEEMGGKRGRQQCRIKWTDGLSKTIKNEGQKPRWGPQDAYILIHKIDSLDVSDDTEIDWKTLPDPAWNLWSAHTLQRRWLTMKRGVPSNENMSHQEIVDTLKSKKVALPFPPPTSSRRRKERKVTSAAAIADADLQRDALGVSAESNTINQAKRSEGGWDERPVAYSSSSDSDS